MHRRENGAWRIAVFMTALAVLWGCVERRGRRTTPRQNQEEAKTCVQGTPPYGPRSLRLLTSDEYQRTVQDLVQLDQNVTQDFPKEVRTRGKEHVTEKSVVTEAHTTAYLKAAAAVAAKVTANLGRFAPCSAGENEETCVGRFLETFGKRALRGPLDSEEKQRLLKVFQDGRRLAGQFAGGIDLVVQAMLMSPRFLYRYELGEPKGADYELTSWELAQALSYTYWGTMPDDRLLDLAQSHHIKKPEILAAETKRLLESPRSQPVLGDFVARWLGAEAVLSVNKDTGRYPQFTSSFREKLLKETKDFFTEQVLNGKGTFETLFAADFTLGDDELARFYGGRRQGETIQLPSRERSGLLGHASVLAAFADADESAPVKRGLFVLERLFCQEIPSPPPAFNIMPPPRNPQATTRERFAAHSQSDACSVCHVRIDGAGFGLEDMDAVGRFRATEAGRPVDASGELVEESGAKIPFRGTAQLARITAKNSGAQHCFVTQVQRYVSGREEKAGDLCAVDGLHAAFAQKQLNLKNLFLTVPLRDSFRKRTP